jgi:hypothetical protein
MTKLYVRIGGRLNSEVILEERLALIQRIFSKIVDGLHLPSSEDKNEDKQVLFIPNREFGGYQNFCFVTVEDDIAEQLIEEFDGQSYDDKDGDSDQVVTYHLTVNVARPLGDRPSTGNRDRGGNRGGGNYRSNNRY